MISFHTGKNERIAMFAFRSPRHPYRVFLLVVAITALGSGLFNEVLSNYFKEVYGVSAYQRGLIEFPRELPGVLAIFFIAILSRFSDIRISLIAQFLTTAGCLTLGLVTPPFGFMLFFVFLNSIGAHLTMPLQDGIGMNLMEAEGMGRQMGQFKGVATAFAMVAGVAVFLGFRTGVFGFGTPIKWVLVCAAVFMGFSGFLIAYLDRIAGKRPKSERRTRFVFRKEYRHFYGLTVMFGVQKQIMLVYGPWVVIELLGKKADTMALLGIAGSFAGTLFMPVLGKWIDRFGIRNLLFADAFSYVGVYLAYGLITTAFVTGALSREGLALFLFYALFVADRMSTQMGMIRTLYLKKIAVESGDVMPTLSLGMSMDHVVSIACAILGGFLWSAWGPQYVFFLAAALSLVNVYIASRVRVR